MNEYWKTIQSVWTSLNVGQRTSIVASVLLVVASLITIVYFSSKPNYTLLFANLPQEEASKVVQFLTERKVPYTLHNGGSTVMVPEAKVYQLRLDLAAEGIPRASDTAGGVGFELLDKNNFGMSDRMQRANYYRALQGELARTIKQMDEIEEARVLVVVPEERLFRPAPRDSKASVFIKLKRNRVLSEAKVASIRFLVANGVEGLEPERVAVIDNFGRALAQDQQNNTLLSLNADQMQIQRNMEDYLREKAQSMLDRVLGPGESVVRVSAEMDFDKINETEEIFDPKSSVLRQETTSTESSTSETLGRSGETGTRPNTELNAEQADRTRANESRETVSNRYEINRIVRQRDRATGNLKRLSVAVFLNQRKPITLAAGETQPVESARTPQEIAQIEEVVKQAVGFDVVRKDGITITEQPFADLMPEEKPTPTEVVMGLSRWAPLATQVWLIIMAIAAFFYFRSLLKAPEQDEESPEGRFAELIERFEKLEKPEPTGNGRAQAQAEEFLAAQAAAAREYVLSVDEMSRLIKENPVNTTQAIKQWLSRN